MAALCTILGSESDITELKEAYHILNLLNHRNKNQHRRDGWWKWFSMLRRAVGRLVREREENNDTRVQSYVAFMNDHLFPNCYLSFTQLVANNQFSALGLVLLAELARTQKAVGARRPNSGSVLDCNEVIDAGVQRPEMALSEDTGEVLPRPPNGGNCGLPAADAVTIAEDISDAPYVESKGQKGHIGDMASPPLLTHRSPVGPIFDAHAGSPSLSRRATERRDKPKKNRKQRTLNPIDGLFEGLS